jgi:hypothetical protein
MTLVWNVWGMGRGRALRASSARHLLSLAGRKALPTSCTTRKAASISKRNPPHGRPDRRQLPREPAHERCPIAAVEPYVGFTMHPQHAAPQISRHRPRSAAQTATPPRKLAGHSKITEGLAHTPQAARPHSPGLPRRPRRATAASFARSYREAEGQTAPPQGNPFRAEARPGNTHKAALACHSRAEGRRLVRGAPPGAGGAPPFSGVARGCSASLAACLLVGYAGCAATPGAHPRTRTGGSLRRLPKRRRFAPPRRTRAAAPPAGAA